MDMSKSVLRNLRMRKTYSREANRNMHKFDEMPKNRPSKFIQLRCETSKVSWLQEPGTFGGHKVKHQGHRMVSGIVRQKIKEEIRQEIRDSER